MKPYTWKQYIGLVNLINSKIKELDDFSIEKERCFKESTMKLFINKLAELCSLKFKVNKRKVKGLIRTQLIKEFYPKYILIYVNKEKVYYRNKGKNFGVAAINGTIYEVRI